MTLSMHGIAVALQWAGLLGSAVGTLLTLALAAALVPGWIVAGIAAVILDVVAIRIPSDARAMGAAIAKLLVVLVAVQVVTLGRAASSAVLPIAPDTGPLLLLLSILPSALGAIFRRTDS